MSTFFPYIIAFAAVGCYAALTVLAKKALLSNLPPFAFISITMLVLFVLSLGASLIFEKKFSLLELRWPEWRSLIIFAVINFIGFGLYLLALQKMPAAHYQLIFAVSPVITAVLAYFLLSEPMAPKFFAGLALVGIGLYVALVK